MSARDAILAALGGGAPSPAVSAEAAALLDGMEHPPMPAATLRPVDAFLDRLVQPTLAATTARIADLAALPGAVAAYLAEHALPAALFLPPDPRLDAGDWTGIARLDTCPIDGGVALAFATAGVAETGSLILDTGSARPMLPDFLALHHIVVVDAATIVPWLEDVPPPAPGPDGRAPRTRYWVTGVSGTTDIEGSYVRGAHGPRFLHVLVAG